MSVLELHPSLEIWNRVPDRVGGGLSRNRNRVTIHYLLPFERLSSGVVKRKVGRHDLISSLSMNRAKEGRRQVGVFSVGSSREVGGECGVEIKAI